MLTFLAIAGRLRPKWIVWENVPGVLSSNGGKDFGSFVGALGQLGYGYAYRVLDAQWIRTQRHPRAVPQRRRRVFVVGCLGDFTSAAKVLFERQSLHRYSAPRRATREGTATNVEEGVGGGGKIVADSLDDQRMPDKDNFGAVLQPVPFVKAKRAKSTTDNETWVEGVVAPTQNAFDVGDVRATTVAIQGTVIGRKDHNGPQGAGCSVGGEMFTLNSTDVHAVAFAQNQVGEVRVSDVAGTLNQNSNATGRNAPLAFFDSPMVVRRLTVTECERLMGFPDGWTLIPYRGKPADQCPDGPRYKALGNSMAVNCMEWIGERIAAVEGCSEVPKRIPYV